MAVRCERLPSGAHTPASAGEAAVAVLLGSCRLLADRGEGGAALCDFPSH